MHKVPKCVGNQSFSHYLHRDFLTSSASSAFFFLFFLFFFLLPPSLNGLHPPSPEILIIFYIFSLSNRPRESQPQSPSPTDQSPPAQCLRCPGPPASRHRQPSNHRLNTDSQNSPTPTHHLYFAHLQALYPPPLALILTKRTTKTTSANTSPAPPQPHPS
jgi:hypothetical protein